MCKTHLKQHLGGFKLGTDVATLEAAQQKRQLEIQALRASKKGSN
jgi:hypothetical protein